MRNNNFGNLVRALRLERTFITPNRRQASWTQEHLAELTQLYNNQQQSEVSLEGELNGLTRKQIADIERGKVSKLLPEVHLEPLAKAFELNEMQKAEFYATAGYVYKPKREVEDRKIVELLLRQHRFASIATNHLWDCLALNTYAYKLFEHNEYTIELMRIGDLGSNLLRVMFDPVFRHKELYGGEEKWREAIIRNLHAFRIMSFQYIASDRYNTIIQKMHDYPEFNRLWKFSQYVQGDRSGLQVQPIITLFNSEYGEMSFLSCRVPEIYIGKSIHISSYLPLEKSEIRYQALQNTIENNDIVFFDVPVLE